MLPRCAHGDADKTGTLTENELILVRAFTCSSGGVDFMLEMAFLRPAAAPPLDLDPTSSLGPLSPELGTLFEIWTFLADSFPDAETPEKPLKLDPLDRALSLPSRFSSRVDVE